MATLTVRNIDDNLKERLRVLAATRGHSMEEEVRLILKRAVGGMTGSNLWELSRQLFEAENGIELALPTRSEDRALPDFGVETRKASKKVARKGAEKGARKAP